MAKLHRPYYRQQHEQKQQHYYHKQSHTNSIYYNLILFCLATTLAISCFATIAAGGSAVVDAISAPIVIDNFDSAPIEPQLNGEEKCQPHETHFCNIARYTTIKPFNNSLGFTNLKDAVSELHKYAFLFERDPCKSKIQLFLCSLYIPICVIPPQVDRLLLLPCRDDCEAAKHVCQDELAMINQGWPEEWDCAKFNYHEHDKLCVINNNNSSQTTRPQMPIPPDPNDPKSNDSPKILPSDPSLPIAPPFAPHDNESICADDMFDCKLTLKDMKSLCIARSYVCDGNKDCVLNEGGIGNDLDEVGCDRKCQEGHLFCDGKCTSNICDGIVDCSDGLDERNCFYYSEWLNLIQVLSFIVALFLVILLLMRLFIRVDDPKEQQDVSNFEDSLEKPRYGDLPEPNHQRIYPILMPPPPPPPPLPSDKMIHRLDKEITQHFGHNTLPTQRYQIYDEPSYSITDRPNGYYQRLTVGGCSGASSVYEVGASSIHGVGASSVYGSYGLYRDCKEPPAAPPPTPAPQSIDSSGSIPELTDPFVYNKQKSGLLH